MRDPKYRISRADIRQALGDKSWDLGNRFLYSMCRDHPHHARSDEIIAKIWLIGRSYSAAIERRKFASADSDSFYTTVVAPQIKRSDLRHWLGKIPRGLTASDTTAPKAISTHKMTMDLFRTISGSNKRSLASKYLHFHRPGLFFLYDRRSCQGIRLATPDVKHVHDKIEAPVFDKEYLRFYRRCLWLRNRIRREFRRSLSPRSIDKILLHVASKYS